MPIRSPSPPSPGRGTLVALFVMALAPVVALIAGADAWLALAGAIMAGLAALLVGWRWFALRRELDLVRAAADRLVPSHIADTTSLEPSIRAIQARIEDEHARLQDALRASAALTGVFDGIDEPVLATDDSGRVLLCNAAAAAFIGSPASRLIGRPIDEVFTHADLLRLLRQASAGLPSRDRLRLPRPEGDRTLDISCLPIRERSPKPIGPSGSSHPVVMTFRDVTELSRAMQVKTDFVANASHELRTPIATIKASLETLEAGAKDDPAMRERIFEALMHQTIRLEEMARDLLDLSRLESAEGHVPRREVSIRAIADLLGPMFARVCQERQLTLRFDLDPALDDPVRPVRSNRALLELILQNLIDNATKYAYEGSTIRVWVQASSPASGAHSGPGLRLEVADQGAGIPLADQSRIFERYYQVDEARSSLGHRRGSGLGLAIVKHAVRSLGGTIRVQSVWKQGTTMIVELPGDHAPTP
jgi:two-component system, OmpR family, phosphate regulon sensor histidine kinase PhoR